MKNEITNYLIIVLTAIVSFSSTTAIARSHQHGQLHWEKAYHSLPAHAVRGGQQYGPYQYKGPLFICKARYRNNMNPGKLINRRCNITWGGREISLDRYKVLVGKHRRYRWVRARNFNPARGVVGGHQNQPSFRGPLYICKADYRGNVFPGKVVARRCNIGFAGREIVLNRYRVLVYR